VFNRNLILSPTSTSGSEERRELVAVAVLSIVKAQGRNLPSLKVDNVEQVRGKLPSFCG